MKIELVEEQWKPYEHLVPATRIAQALVEPQGALDEEITEIVPNIELGIDGPIVQSIIVFSASYIGEARLSDEEENFDFAIKDTIASYRIQLGKHEVVRNAAAIEAAKAKGEELPAAEKTIYQTGVVTFLHLPFELTTVINYFGQNRTEWLKRIKTIVPVTILKRSIELA